MISFSFPKSMLPPVLSLLAALPLHVGAQITCPATPNSVTSISRDVKNDFSLQVGALGKLKLGELSNKTESTAKNLFGKYPQVDRLVALELMSSTFCSMLQQSKIPDREKLDRWERFQKSVLGIQQGEQPPANANPKPRPAQGSLGSPVPGPQVSVQGGNSAGGVQVGINSGSIVVVPSNSAQAPAVISSDFASRHSAIRLAFHKGTADPQSMVTEIETLLRVSRDPELQLIRATLLTYLGNQAEAELAIRNLTGLKDPAEAELIRKMYGIFISTYKPATQSSVFSSRTFFSIDGRMIFYGPNLARSQYKDWQRAFHDIWLILPIFNANGNSPRAPRTFYASILEDYPNLAWAHAMIALDSFEKENYRQALEEVNASLQIDGEQPRALRIRAILYGLLGNTQKSLDDYARSLRLQPSDPLTHVDQGITLGRLGRHAESFQSYDKATKVAPDYYRAYQLRGTASLRLGDTQAALRDFALVKRESKDAVVRWHAFANSITAYTLRGDFTLARTQMTDKDFLEAAKANEPESTKAIQQLSSMIDSIQLETQEKGGSSAPQTPTTATER